MIAMNDIKKAITKRLYGFFNTSLTIYGEVNKKQLQKPCLLVDIVPISSIKLNVDVFNKYLLIDITYLNLEQSKEDNYLMIDNMQSIFDQSLQVDETYLHILELDFKIVNNVLHTQFKLNYMDSIDGITVDNIYVNNSVIDDSLGYTKDTIMTMQDLQINN